MTVHDSQYDILTFGGGAAYWKSVIDESSSNFKVLCGPKIFHSPERLSEVRCLVGWNFPDKLFELLPKLQWIQSISVGVDSLVTNPQISANVRISNTRGLYGDAIAEYVVWAMLTLYRQFNVVLRNQEKRRWRQISGSGLSGKTIGIVGLGDVGTHVARQAQRMQMQTIGFVRKQNPERKYDAVDLVVPTSQLLNHTPDLDALILCAPLTDLTAGIVNQEVIDKMKKSAIVINICRAGLIEGSTVIDALNSGRISGAAIDVFDSEPIPRWSPLWKTSNLIITPHVSALTPDYKTRVADLLEQNMVRFATGQPLLNEVDRSKGY